MFKNERFQFYPRVNNYKPYPEGITKAINKLGVDKEEVLYVGDSLVDQQTALAAGVNHAASLWSNSQDDFDTQNYIVFDDQRILSSIHLSA